MVESACKRVNVDESFAGMLSVWESRFRRASQGVQSTWACTLSAYILKATPASAWHSFRSATWTLTLQLTTYALKWVKGCCKSTDCRSITTSTATTRAATSSISSSSSAAKCTPQIKFQTPQYLELLQFFLALDLDCQGHRVWPWPDQAEGSTPGACCPTPRGAFDDWVPLGVTIQGPNNHKTAIHKFMSSNWL